MKDRLETMKSFAGLFASLPLRLRRRKKKRTLSLNGSLPFQDFFSTESQRTHPLRQPPIPAREK